jgi:hypothetical protein
MRQTILRVTPVVAAIGLGLTLCMGAAQAASSRGWHLAFRSTSATPAPLSSVIALSASDAWAVGVTGPDSAAQALVLHWDGSRWGAVTIPGASGFRPATVESSSADNVWIFGNSSSGPQAMVWNGSSWRAMTLPYTFGLGSAAVLSSTDVWGTGEGSSCTGGTCTTTVWHWDGTGWASSQVSGLMQDITGAGGAAWLLTLTSLHHLNTNPTGLPTVYRSAGSAMQPVAAPGTRIADSAGIAAAPSGQLWMLGPPATTPGPGLLFHWTGHRWTQSPIPAKVSGSSQPFIVSYTATYDGQKGIWAGPDAHWTGTRWLNTNQTASLPGADTFALLATAAIPGSTSVWAAGWVGHTRTDNTHDSLIAVYGGLP